ncbi:MAG TPA: glycosyltransferase family A protein, partial [Candidatus Dormibacteraeota bacterium]|nr:glycosyltransferase family A protein [Candidatus Dormibacteraeota bacterium]
MTVLMPNFNHARFLPQSVGSVLGQTYSDWRLIVSDNASTDESLQVLAGFDDPRISIIRQDINVGLMPNINLLLGQLTGDFSVVLPADDWWEPTFLEETVSMLDAH